MASSRREQLKAIRDEVVALTSSPLYTFRTKNTYHPVLGEGNHYASIVFIGEAPGRNEAETGRPFCGAAGRILDQLLQSVSVGRADVYITNIIKDRPPGNRDPTEEEIALYAPFLRRQLEIIKPALIATLGRFSTYHILSVYTDGQHSGSISALRGRLIRTKSPWGAVTILPLFHPAVAIYNPTLLPDMKKDVQHLRQFIRNRK
jgi:DNA polymerase